MGSGVNERVWKAVSGVGRNTGGIATGWLSHRAGDQRLEWTQWAC